MADTFLDRQPLTPNSAVIGSIPISFGTVDQDLSTRKVRWLLISTAGTLKMTFADGTVDSHVLAVGLYPYDVTLIWHTGSSTVVGNVLY